MFKFIGTIQDAYGLVHTDPVFVVSNFNSSSSSDAFGSYNKETGEYDISTNQNEYLNYSIDYWSNEAAQESNKRSITFYDDNHNMNFNFQPGQKLTTEEEYLDAISYHFLNTVLSDFVVDDE